MKVHDFTVPAIMGMLLLAAPQVYGQAADKQQFEVVSVKLNNGCQNNRGKDPMPSPGRLQIPCVPVQNLIQVAYGGFSGGKPEQIRVTGGPDWLQSDFYSIAAKGDGPTPVSAMAGPMLRALLEDRFHLKVHKENREMPVYALVMGKNSAKLQPTAEGSCVKIDLDHLPAEPGPGKPMPNFCGGMQMRMNRGVIQLEAHGATMKELAERLSAQLDRPVIDKTGIEGMFDVHLEFAPDPTISGKGMFVGRGEAGRGGDGGPPAMDLAGPNIITALQEQLGLKLSPEKGPVEFLVIDHVEKPAEN
jgi:uncharacterized protein (TIGR03435 family)